jgi:hypothetical protein
MTEETNTLQSDRPDRSRPTRIPLGQRNRLTFTNLDPAFVYRVINDQEDRLIRAQEAGYEFVSSDQQLGDTTVMTPKKVGKKVSKPVGNGVNGYLMRIPKEWYDEDQKAKMKKVDESERAMKPNTATGQYGKGLTNE